MAERAAFVLLLAGLLVGTVRADVPGGRLRLSLNDGWRYADGPQAGAEAPGFADTGWQRVDLPHTWNDRDAFDKGEGYRQGEGWYRRRLAVPPELRGQRLFLYFEGANQVADVFVNGSAVGRHVGGYTAFAFDVTDQLRGGEATLVVRVDNRDDPAIPPLNADFTFYGGIYRNVWLVATAPVHFDALDHAGPGVYVSTPEASAARATVRVHGRVQNDGDAGMAVEVVARVLDVEGQTVATVRAPVRAAAGQGAAFEGQAVLDRPHLWSPDNPYLYRIVAEVRRGAAVLDRVEVPLGVRWVGVDAARGFLLNGQPYRLTGTNRHQDFPGLGNALPDDHHRRDVRLVKENGFNFLRLAHYPQAPAVLAEADRRGLALWEEIPVVNIITPSEAFAANAERMLVEMIRQHYNHPSVVMWGWMNEPLLRRPNPMPEGYIAALVALARRLDARAKAEDPSRLTAAAISFDEVDDGSGLQDVPDVLGLNLYFGWYYRTLDGLGPYLDSLHARHPGRPLFISEYGAGHDERVHARRPVAFDFSTEHAQRFHRETLPQFDTRPWLVGTAVWNQFDFGSNHRQDTRNAINNKGLFYFDRTPKDVAFYYRARLTTAPVLHLEREDLRRAGSRAEDRTQPVRLYTNAPAAELLHDGASLGTQRIENATAVWTVTMREGINRFVARTPDGRADAVEVHYTDRTRLFNAPAPGDEVAVNVGGAYRYTDAAGTVWEEDRAYVPGGWGYTGGTATRTYHRIVGTDEDALFQAARTGDDLGYGFDVPDGAYTLTLGFADAQHAAPGARRFSVRANGVPVAADLDLAAEAGRWTAVTRTVDLVVTGGGGLVLAFEAGAGAPLLNTLRLRRG